EEARHSLPVRVVRQAGAAAEEELPAREEAAAVAVAGVVSSRMLKGIMKRQISLDCAARVCRAGILVYSVLILTGAACSFAAETRRPPPPAVGKAFPSPDSAAEALADAAKTKDRAALKAVLGPESDELQMSDRAQADQELADFAAAFDASHRLVRN